MDRGGNATASKVKLNAFTGWLAGWLLEGKIWDSLDLGLSLDGNRGSSALGCTVNNSVVFE